MSDVLLLRADASSRIGTGHIMRCIALAQGWREAGGRVVFAHAETTGAMARRLEAERLESVGIDAAPGSVDDAARTSAIARELEAAWVVADGYAFGAAWQEAVKRAGLRLLLADDCGHAESYCADLILNQNLHADAALYSRRASHTRLLLGAKFVQLRREFAAWGNWRRSFPEVADKVLVTLGGGDPDNATAKVLRALARLKGVEATVVVGGSNPNRAAIEALAESLGGGFKVVVGPANMPELMASADLAVSAGGSTSWELAFMGLPTVAIAIADNQRPIVQSLVGAGCAADAGWFQDLDEERLAGILEDFRRSRPMREAMSARQRRLVDGHGVRRILAAMGRSLRISLLSDEDSWINPFLSGWVTELRKAGHAVEWIHSAQALVPGDIAFLLSYSRIVPPALLRLNAQNLVVHESDLPRGRGWSPLSWQVLEGADRIPVTLLEAAEGVDSGPIYSQATIQLRGNELVDELRAAQAAATLALCTEFISRHPFVLADAREQSGTPTYYPRRGPADSRLDPDKTLREQFQLLRIADFERYPAHFEIAGRRFSVRITAMPDEPSP